MIGYGRQDICGADCEAVMAVLQSDYLTQGPVVPRFEQAIAAYTGARHAVAVNSGTSALHVACLALDLGPGDWLWTSTNSFVASANCGLYCGASVDFVDIDPHTYNLSVAALGEKLERAAGSGTLPKIVVSVHFAGQPCDMRAIARLGRQYGFRIIEDGSHAIGARYRDTPVGSCQYSDITVFSFHPVKIITTAEGGMATTNDADLARRMARLRSHGITRDPEDKVHTPDGPWDYQQLELGYNYRMTELQAALGLSQLQRLDRFVARRHELAARYDQLLSDLPLTRPFRDPRDYSALHLYPVQVANNRRQWYECLHRAGIGVNVHYIPIHTQPYFRERGFRPGQFPVAENYYRYALSLPLFPSLTPAEHDLVVDSIRQCSG